MKPLPVAPFDPLLPTRVLFLGGGQDSVALLLMYLYWPQFRTLLVGRANFVVVMADTGNEYPETVDYVATLKDLCRRTGIDFTLVTPDMGFHGRTWPSLMAQMERNNNIMGVAFPKSCTDNLKIKVCYRFLAQWLREHYGYTGADPAVYDQYRYAFGKIISWIGFAAGEESRVASPVRATPGRTSPAKKTTDGPVQGELFAVPDTGPSYVPRWRKRCVTHRYPLLELGYDRAACQQVIAGYGHPVPMPSNCMCCPFQNEAEIVFLYRTNPAMWRSWVEREKAKLAKFADRKLNLGVKGKLSLPEFLDKALLTYGAWSIDQLTDYRFSHGHCVGSKI